MAIIPIRNLGDAGVVTDVSPTTFPSARTRKQSMCDLTKVRFVDHQSLELF